MTSATLSQWLDALGYAGEPQALHRRAEAIGAAHPYASELRTLLDANGPIRANAVFDVEGVPTVVFVEGESDRPLTAEALNAVRQRLWNQNLVSVVLAITDKRAVALPVPRLPHTSETLHLAEASPYGHFSAAEIRSSDLARRLDTWFRPQIRVDQKLLQNLGLTVEQLTRVGIVHSDAQLLIGQLLFVAYLEHRGIVSPVYREQRDVGSMHALIKQNDQRGLLRLIEQLRHDFNGDFLAQRAGEPNLWATLSPAAFEVLDRFLARVDMGTGEQDFWNYDFSYIPVELLSALYESFLTDDEQEALSAYYTPRHLAVLAVDEALRELSDPCDLTVFDGACGSGILLTTTFRRLIALSEAHQGKQLHFAERCSLLKRSIFGADLHPVACRVSAFSLYLALLEGLNPPDISALQDLQDVKLPTLTGSNLFSGRDANIFSPNHPLAGRQFHLAISNPPWKEPSGDSRGLADEYASKAGAPFVRRQSAGLFAFRVLDFVRDGGTFCLILPVPLFVSPTSGPFIRGLLTRARPKRLINFGDLQGLLFPTGENACQVFTGVKRAGASMRIRVNETFDYWVPKADLSLALGRLTLLSADRHVVQTQALLDDPQWLVSLMWGDNSDMALLTRLGLRGQLKDRLTGHNARWRTRMGIHLEDRSRDATSADPLREIPFAPIERLREGLPVLHGRDLFEFPRDVLTVVGLNDDLLEVFDGPRILFPGGFSREEAEVRTNYLDGPASFTSSVGVIAGPREDAALLQFLSLYLRSSLAKYFLLMRCWRLSCDRNSVLLKDLYELPFHTPEDAADPRLAEETLQKVSGVMRQLRALGRTERKDQYQELRPAIDELVFDYFKLTSRERRLVEEAVAVLLPSVRPRSFKSLDTPAQRRARAGDLRRYATTLAAALDEWRDALGGKGHFEVNVCAAPPARTGALGAVRVSVSPGRAQAAQAEVRIEDAAVAGALKELREQAMSPQTVADVLQLSPDTLIWTAKSVYLVRPLARRAWMERAALRDAERIVREVHASAEPPATKAVA